MTTHDIQGRSYTNLSQLKPGDIVVVNDDFDCIKAWSEHEVHQAHELIGSAGLYIACDEGRHWLDSQLDSVPNSDTLIGIYRKEDFTLFGK